MKDFLYRGIIDGLNARFAVVHATATANAGVIAHNADPASALLLCRALGSGLLISPLLQDDHRFTVTWMYEGPAQKLIVDVGADSDIRGLITGKNLSSIS
jgi:redox-regulated HSP33 family molecular chaperone